MTETSATLRALAEKEPLLTRKRELLDHADAMEKLETEASFERELRYEDNARWKRILDAHADAMEKLERRVEALRIMYQEETGDALSDIDAITDDYVRLAGDAAQEDHIAHGPADPEEDNV